MAKINNVVLLLAAIAACAFFCEVHGEKGFCGENVKWYFNKGNLTINGTGMMTNFSGDSEQPWSSLPITNVTVEKGVTSIGDYAFSSTSLINATIAASVKYIGTGAFSGCNNLVNVSMAPGVTVIGGFAFYRTGLINVTVPNTVKRIGSSAFSSCSSLVNVSLSTNLTAIEDSTFYMCPKLINATIPNGTQVIGKGAFYGCKNMVNLTIPETVVNISDLAFFSCINLTNASIPTGVKSIGAFAFSETGMKNVSLPSTVKFIGQGAFRNCTKLRKVFFMGNGSLEGKNVFEKTPIENICVSPDYNSTKFCGAAVSSSGFCRPFAKMFNHCFEAVSFNGTFISKKRINATEWENSDLGCQQRICLNESGPVSWTTCNSSNSVSRMCLRDQCVDDWTNNIHEGYVVIEFDRVKFHQLNKTALAQNLTSLANVYINSSRIGVETDGFANVKHVIVSADSRSSRQVATALYSIDKYHQCKYGILCQQKNISVRLADDESAAQSVHSVMKGVMAMVLAAVVMAFF